MCCHDISVVAVDYELYIRPVLILFSSSMESFSFQSRIILLTPQAENLSQEFSSPLQLMMVSVRFAATIATKWPSRLR